MGMTTELKKELRETHLKFAIYELEKAVEAIDQAHAAMKDLNIHNYVESKSNVITKGLTAGELYRVAASLLENLRKFDLKELDEYDQA